MYVSSLGREAGTGRALHTHTENSLRKGMAAEKGNPFRADEVSTGQG